MPPSEILETFYHFSITRYNLFIYVFNKQGDLGFLNTENSSSNSHNLKQWALLEKDSIEFKQGYSCEYIFFQV